jgi:hypothetical protein
MIKSIALMTLGMATLLTFANVNREQLNSWLLVIDQSPSAKM